MSEVAVDFETYYDKELSISVQGMVGYIEHPDFDPYMVSIVGADKDGRQIAWAGHPDEAPWHRVDGITWASHNYAFDGYVFKWMTEQRGRNWGLGPAKDQWFCTADLAAYMGSGRSLVQATAALLPDLEGHSKDLRNIAKGKTPIDLKALGLWDKMLQYAIADSVECLELWKRFNKFWPANERRLSRRTAEWGWRGVAVDVPLLEAGINKLEYLLWEAGGKIPWVPDEPPTAAGALTTHCQVQNWAGPPSTSKDDEGFQKWKATLEEEIAARKLYNCEWQGLQSCIDAVAAMGEYRSVNKMLCLLNSIKALLRADGTMPYAIKYFGAHTGRWSGGADRDAGDIPKTINMQNIYGKEKFGIDVRAMFIPRPGHKFVIVDLSQIEPRCLAWASGMTSFLERVASGISPYVVHAELTMGHPKDTAVDKGSTFYKLAKARVLSLGYGCGWNKFINMAAKGGLEVTEEVSKETVSDYRASNTPITGFWKKLQVGLQTSARAQENFVVDLPSGRQQIYKQPHYRKEREMNEDTGKWRVTHQLVARVTLLGSYFKFYGGKLCENIIQAIARDVFAENLLHLEDYLITHQVGDIAWHVHDEAIVEVPENLCTPDCHHDAPCGSCMRDNVENILSYPIPWLPGCPVAAEAGIHDHYTK